MANIQTNQTLLDRQRSLLDHLTGAQLIAGDVSGVAADMALRGLDSERLRLEAHFSFHKRLGKIRAMFPRTLHYLAGDEGALWQAFAEAHPPATNSQFDNGLQFHDFLTARWATNAPEPPYLADLAGFELAFARVRRFKGAGPVSPAATGAVRRHPSVVLVRSGYDLLSLLDGGSEQTEPEKREVFYVIHMQQGEPEPRVFEIGPPVHALLAALAEWASLKEICGDGPPALTQLVRAFIDDGILEVAP